MARKGKPEAKFIGGIAIGWPQALASLFAFALFGLVAVYTHGASDMRLQGTILFFMSYGFLLVCAFAIVPPNGKRIGWKFGGLLVIATLFLASNAARPALLNYSMGMMGLRSFPGDAVIVSEAVKQNVEGIASAYGISLRACELHGLKQWILRDGRAVWHGVGTTSYLRIFDAAADGTHSVLIPVDRKSVTVIRRDHATLIC